jgi:feruloyl esterase
MLNRISSGIALTLVFGASAAQANRDGDERQSQPAACSGLAAFTSEGNTTITSATLVTSGSVTVTTPTGTTTTYTHLPDFCRVIGVSKPTSDSNINFEAWLPTSATWNGKFLSNGEGGYVGVIGYAGIALYLQRGYATVSTDTGHLSSNPWWAVGHRQRAIDYLYRAKHLTTVATKGLIKTFYGKAASHNYFQSCSNGGRQGWLEIQRYPGDFDGLIVGAPWNFQSHSNAGFVWDAQALSVPGAALPVAKLPNITAAVLAACDANDGLVDGIVTNPLTCKFNPDTLLCTGAETRSCLTAPQLAALKKIYAGPSNPRTGRQIFPGFAVGSERQWTGLVVNFKATGLGTGYFGNLTYEDPAWDYSKFNFDSDLAYADFRVGLLGNAINTDLADARERGVKIIQYHGWEDQTLQPEYSPQWYAGLLSPLHDSRDEALLRRSRRVGRRTGHGATAAGARRPARRPDRARELGRARKGPGQVHRDEVHHGRRHRNDGPVHAAALRASEDRTVQGRRSELCCELRLRPVGEQRRR